MMNKIIWQHRRLPEPSMDIVPQVHAEEFIHD
jgi:hypothetical protein